MDPIIRNRFTACTGRLALATLLAMFPLLSPAAEGPAASPGDPAEPAADTEEARRQRIGWWRDARFGLFIHWGLYAIPAGAWKDIPGKAPLVVTPH